MPAPTHVKWPLVLNVVSALLCSVAVLVTMVMSLHSMTSLRQNYVWAEDGLVETVSALFYALGFLTCLVLIAKRRLGWACVWLALTFLFLGEETSWFQRWLGYSVPLVEQRNVQGEFNLHNLDYLQRRGPLVSLADGLSINFSELINSENLFRLGFAAYFLLIPLLARLPSISRMIRAVKLPLPPPYFLLCLWSSIALSVAAAPFLQDRLPLSEVREMICAWFIFIYCIAVLAGPTRDAHPG